MGFKLPGGFKSLLAATALMGGTLVGVACGGDDDGGSTINNTPIDAGGSSSSGNTSGSSSGGTSSSGGNDAGQETTYSVGGTVTGLGSATGLVLQLNGANNLSVTADGVFVFPTKLTDGSQYTVTIATQPTGKTCSVSAGVGSIAKANATGVVVNCAAAAFTVGGTVSGLATGASVTLTLNGANALVRNANGTYAFATTIAQGGAYAVAVSVQPTNPTQVCTVSNGSGTMGAANVTNVNVSCTTSTFTVGGTVSGLATGSSLVIQNNLGGNKTISANGAYSFPAQNSGTAYSVTVLTQPSNPVQTCTVANPSGTVGGANVTNANISCTTQAFKVGGNLTGLAGGKSIVLTNNNGDDLTLDTDGKFEFTTAVASGSPYNVQVKTQPAGQNCSVSAGSGNVGSGAVTTVVVNCGNTFTVGGNVTGLAGGASVILRNNNNESVEVSGNTSFAFPTPLTDTSAYAVTVQTQPSNPTQTCVVTNGSGNIAGANVTTVAVTCTTNKYKVGGTITGLAPGENTTVQLAMGTGETFQIVANGNWVFPTSVDSGTSYDVNVTIQPTGAIEQTCTVENGAGKVGAGDVTNVSVVCAPKQYKVGGNVSGLEVGAQLVLQNNGADNKSITQNGAFEFDTTVPSGGSYSVAVFQQPGTPSQTCVVTNGSGPVTNAAITTVSVTCTTNSFMVGGRVSGLDLTNGNQVVLTNTVPGAAPEDVTVGANTTFQFATSVLSGKTYTVTVKTQPTNPAQTCTVSAGTGTVGGSDVTSVRINCATNTYTIGGTVTNLAPGNHVILQNNLGDDLDVSTAGSFAFDTPIASGQTYSVTVLTSPTSPVSQTCTVTGGGTGTVTNADITTVAINCVTNTFTVGGTVTGLEPGTQVVLTNNGADDKTVLAADGTFTFATAINSGQTYEVKVKTNPASPPFEQVCTVTGGGTGTIGNANVTDVAINCVTTEYTVQGTLFGLAQGSIAIQNNANAADQIVLSSNTSYAFTVKVKNGHPLDVQIVSQPNVQEQICKVVDGTGTMPAANKTVNIYCGWTCNSIHQNQPALPSGDYTIDPDGSGPIAQTTAYCDMTFDGGGWSLIESTISGLGPTQLTAGIVTTGTAKFMPLNVASALANRSSRVHVRSTAATPTKYVTSFADLYPIRNLRNGNILNYGIAPLPGNAANAPARAGWETLANVNLTQLDFSCTTSATSFPNIYHACGNGVDGWHLVATETTWSWNNGNPSGAEVPMEVYVK